MSCQSEGTSYLIAVVPRSRKRLRCIRAAKDGRRQAHGGLPLGIGPNPAWAAQVATKERDRAIADKLGALLRATEAQPKQTSNIVPMGRGLDSPSDT
jgi:hypothetical protein